MKHLKEFKLFESNITIAGRYQDDLNSYLEKLDITLSDLNDVFRDLLDYDYISYLQLFYIYPDGVRYSAIQDTRQNSSYGEKFYPYLSISFYNENIESLSIMNQRGTKDNFYTSKTDILECFTESLGRLKSMIGDEYKVLWHFDVRSPEVCIYFDMVQGKWRNGVKIE